jgi:hypothetical protein
MDAFRQQKLSKAEWVSIEKSVDEKEKVILKLIKNGLHENGKIFMFNTIGTIVNLDHSEKDYYIYIHLLKEMVDPIIEEYKLATIQLVIPKKKLNGADTIRLTNQKKKLTDNIETTIIQLIAQFLKDTKKKKGFYLYNICYLMKNYTINKHLEPFVKWIIDTNINSIDIVWFLENTDTYIELNNIFNYAPIELYDHQKEVFNIFKVSPPNPTLVCLRTPTNSGKTQTPIGLCSSYKVIFMCASRHIGIKLAKDAINAGVKVGFALGCSTADDVRLHFSAVNSYTTVKNKKRPDHTDGTKLELIICDIQSYEVAMLYMLSFFQQNNIILVIDEPTITMDYTSHELHSSISNIWKINVIQHIVLSSATLPNENDLAPMIEKFKHKFENGIVHYIETSDETTNITLLDETGNVIMPHTTFTTYDEIIRFIDVHGKSHMKYMSVVECSIFILYVGRVVFKSANIQEMYNSYFGTIDKINSLSIRKYYYELIKQINPSEYQSIIKGYLAYRGSSQFDVGVDITSKHSYTLTYGPTIFLCKNIQEWTNYFIKTSGIHFSVYDELEKLISYNNTLMDKITKKQKLLEDKTAKDAENENKIKEQRFDPEIKRLIGEIDTLERAYKPLKLNNNDIPNTREHFMRWNSTKYENSCVFTSNISDEYVRKIMNLTLDTKYKILMLMGIGIFNPEEDMGDYNDIMKELAEQKYLMCIIASSDYIYGTNYQFCHAYLTEDMTDMMTQEKIIQAIGRVGRKEKNKKFTFRFKNNKMIEKLYIKQNTIESDNMNRLFF